jgi:subtilisin family serine protease
VDGDPNDTTDPGRYYPWNQPGHGTATGALLAGRRLAIPDSGFDEFLGGAPYAEVVPIRIADSVIHFRTISMAAGINHAVDTACDVVSISMGGVPSRAWATAVNRAYEAGVAIFAAAGNRFGPSPPSSTVYPARFGRVVAVSGVTADGSPYYRSGLHRHMQGCFGPASKMGTAIAAYTPNAPWAIMGCTALVGFGGGTSSATPQIAAAAALWLQAAAIPTGTEPWQKVEAVRRALFSTARKDVPDCEKYFGQGLVRARAALDVAFAGNLPKTPVDRVTFPWLRAIGVLEALPPEPTGPELMYEVESLQVFLLSPHLQELVGGADPHGDSLSPADFRKLVTAMRVSPLISRALRDHLDGLHRRLSPGPGAPRA